MSTHLNSSANNGRQNGKGNKRDLHRDDRHGVEESGTKHKADKLEEKNDHGSLSAQSRTENLAQTRTSLITTLDTFLKKLEELQVGDASARGLLLSVKGLRQSAQMAGPNSTPETIDRLCKLLNVNIVDSSDSAISKKLEAIEQAIKRIETPEDVLHLVQRRQQTTELPNWQAMVKLLPPHREVQDIAPAEESAKDSWWRSADTNEGFLTPNAVLNGSLKSDEEKTKGDKEENNGAGARGESKEAEETGISQKKDAAGDRELTEGIKETIPTKPSTQPALTLKVDSTADGNTSKDKRKRAKPSRKRTEARRPVSAREMKKELEKCLTIIPIAYKCIEDDPRFSEQASRSEGMDLHDDKIAHLMIIKMMLGVFAQVKTEILPYRQDENDKWQYVLMTDNGVFIDPYAKRCEMLDRVHISIGGEDDYAFYKKAVDSIEKHKLVHADQPETLFGGRLAYVGGIFDSYRNKAEKMLEEANRKAEVAQADLSGSWGAEPSLPQGQSVSEINLSASVEEIAAACNVPPSEVQRWEKQYSGRRDQEGKLFFEPLLIGLIQQGDISEAKAICDRFDIRILREGSDNKIHLHPLELCQRLGLGETQMEALIKAKKGAWVKSGNSFVIDVTTLVNSLETSPSQDPFFLAQLKQVSGWRKHAVKIPDIRWKYPDGNGKIQEAVSKHGVDAICEEDNISVIDPPTELNLILGDEFKDTYNVSVRRGILSNSKLNSGERLEIVISKKFGVAKAAVLIVDSTPANSSIETCARFQVVVTDTAFSEDSSNLCSKLFQIFNGIIKGRACEIEIRLIGRDLRAGANVANEQGIDGMSDGEAFNKITTENSSTGKALLGLGFSLVPKTVNADLERGQITAVFKRDAVRKTDHVVPSETTVKAPTEVREDGQASESNEGTKPLTVTSELSHMEGKEPEAQTVTEDKERAETGTKGARSPARVRNESDDRRSHWASYANGSKIVQCEKVITSSSEGFSVSKRGRARVVSTAKKLRNIKLKEGDILICQGFVPINTQELSNCAVIVVPNMPQNDSLVQAGLGAKQVCLAGAKEAPYRIRDDDYLQIEPDGKLRILETWAELPPIKLTKEYLTKDDLKCLEKRPGETFGISRGTADNWLKSDELKVPDRDAVSAQELLWKMLTDKQFHGHVQELVGRLGILSSSIDLRPYQRCSTVELASLCNDIGDHKLCSVTIVDIAREAGILKKASGAKGYSINVREFIYQLVIRGYADVAKHLAHYFELELPKGNLRDSSITAAMFRKLCGFSGTSEKIPRHIDSYMSQIRGKRELNARITGGGSAHLYRLSDAVNCLIRAEDFRSIEAIAGAYNLSPAELIGFVYERDELAANPAFRELSPYDQSLLPQEVLAAVGGLEKAKTWGLRWPDIVEQNGNWRVTDLLSLLTEAGEYDAVDMLCNKLNIRRISPYVYDRTPLGDLTASLEEMVKISRLDPKKFLTLAKKSRLLTPDSRLHVEPFLKYLRTLGKFDLFQTFCDYFDVRCETKETEGVWGSVGNVASACGVVGAAVSAWKKNRGLRVNGENQIEITSLIDSILYRTREDGAESTDPIRVKGLISRLSDAFNWHRRTLVIEESNVE